jgi:hypothetical protein
MTAYDDFKQTDHLSQQLDDYKARLAAKAADIRADMLLEDNIQEIECDGSMDAKVCAAITAAYINGTLPELKAFADEWMDKEAERLALKWMERQE